MRIQPLGVLPLGTRPEAELEAESTAYVVCASAGLDSSDYTFGYVATWAGGGDAAIAALKASGQRIQRAASEILALLDIEVRSPG